MHEKLPHRFAFGILLFFIFLKPCFSNFAALVHALAQHSKEVKWCGKVDVELKTAVVGKQVDDGSVSSKQLCFFETTHSVVQSYRQ